MIIIFFTDLLVNVYRLSFTTLKWKLHESRDLIYLAPREQSMAGRGVHSRFVVKEVKQSTSVARSAGPAPLPSQRGASSPPPKVDFHCPEETAAGHPGSSPLRPCSAPQPQAARQPTSRAFSWPTSPAAACLAKPLSSSPSPFTWLWEAMRCVFVVLFTSSIFILHRSGAKTSVENRQRVTHARNSGYHAAVTRRFLRARLFGALLAEAETPPLLIGSWLAPPTYFRLCPRITIPHSRRLGGVETPVQHRLASRACGLIWG